MKENDSNYLNQSQFANFLTENGLKYDRAEVKNHYDRGLIPTADLIVSGTKYWLKSAVQQYCQQKQRRLN